MKRILRAAILLLALAIGGEVYWLWLAVEPVHAQTTPFLSRPYYGPAVDRYSIFDHEFPQYQGEGTDPTIKTSVVRHDGWRVPNSTLDDCPKFNCYSGHDGNDFTLVYKPVVSSAPGTISVSGWHYSDHTLGLGLRVKVNHGNNHQTVYGHLSMVRYQPPMNVQRFQIGTSGTSGNSSGPHLHFGVEFNKPGVGWVVKDPYGWTGGYTDPWSTRTLGGVVVGTTSEFLWLPEPDRTNQPPNLYEAYTVDDGDTGTSTTCLYGNHWHPVSGAGWNSDLRYTFANGRTVNCVASWGGVSPPPPFTLPSTGMYEIQVYIPYWDASNRTHAARYTIVSPAGPLTVVVDQSRVGVGNPPTSEWISLGRYIFNAGNLQFYYVSAEDTAFVGDFTDLTSRRVLIDAVRWIRAHP